MTETTFKSFHTLRDMHLFDIAACAQAGDFAGALRTMASGQACFFKGEAAEEDQAMFLQIAKKALEQAQGLKDGMKEEISRSVCSIGRNMISVVQGYDACPFRSDVHQMLFSVLLTRAKKHSQGNEKPKELVGSLRRFCLESISMGKGYSIDNDWILEENRSEERRALFLLLTEGGEKAPVEAFDVLQEVLEPLEDKKKKEMVNKRQGELWQGMESLVACMHLRGKLSCAISRANSLFSMTDNPDFKRSLLRRTIDYVEKASVGKRHSFEVSKIVRRTMRFAAEALEEARMKEKYTSKEAKERGEVEAQFLASRQDAFDALSAVVGIYLRDGVSSKTFEDSLSGLEVIEGDRLVERLEAQPVIQRGLLTMCAAFDASLKKEKAPSSTQRLSLVTKVRGIYMRTTSESVARMAETVMQIIAGEPLLPASRKMLEAADVIAKPVVPAAK